MANLATLVSRQNVVEALKEIIAQNIQLRHSTGYDLQYKGRRFPPKEVVRQAARIAGISIDEHRLNGGNPTNKPLENLGFTIITKNQEIQPTLTAQQFLTHMAAYLDKTPLSEKFSSFEFKGKDTMTSAGTVVGGWDPAGNPSFKFSNTSLTYLFRLTGNGYIVVESLHRVAQIRNFFLDDNTFVNQNGTVYLKENYKMTVGGGGSAKTTNQRAMYDAGFPSDDTILSFEEDDFDEKSILQVVS